MSIDEIEQGERTEVEHVSFLDRLADELAGTVNVNAVFGTAVERDGVTVIPVAKARWGMGGGLAPQTPRERESERNAERRLGGGGGAIVKPIGFIVLTEGRAKFRSMRTPMGTAFVAVVAGILGLFGAKAIASVREPELGARFKMRTRARRLSRLFR
jgi:uncharacterized spore protein YtfJ